MNEHIFELCVGGRPIRFMLRDPAAARFFAIPLRPCDDERYDVAADDELMNWGRIMFPPGVSEASMEYKLLVAPTAQFLLRFSASVFHAVAFRWREKAWLLCAASGTGKSTQFRQWRTLCGSDAELISGDMPILTLEPDGEVHVWPSPWPGKERWIGTASAPLGGLIFLEQAKENTIEPLLPEQSLSRLFGCCSGRPDRVEDIEKLAALLDAILSGHPAWLLRNRGDLDSARLTMGELEAYLTKGAQR